MKGVPIVAAKTHHNGDVTGKAVTSAINVASVGIITR